MVHSHVPSTRRSTAAPSCSLVSRSSLWTCLETPTPLGPAISTSRCMQPTVPNQVFLLTVLTWFTLVLQVTQAVFDTVEVSLNAPSQAGSPASALRQQLGGGGRPVGLQLPRSEFREAVEVQLRESLAEHPLMEDFDVACR